MLTSYILEASRTAATNNAVTMPGVSWLPQSVLKLTRVTLASILTILGGGTLLKWGLPGFVWFLSDWGLLFSIITMDVLAAAHFMPYNWEYDNFAKTCF